MMIPDLPWVLAAAVIFFIVCLVAVWGSLPGPLQGAEAVPVAAQLRALRVQRRRRSR